MNHVSLRVCLMWRNISYDETHFTIKDPTSNLFSSLPNINSTYGYGSLLKIAVKKDRKYLTQHPILYCEVFVNLHITAYCIHILALYTIHVVSKLVSRLKGVCVPCLHSYIPGCEFPTVSCGLVRPHSYFYNKTAWWIALK